MRTTVSGAEVLQVLKEQRKPNEETQETLALLKILAGRECLCRHRSPVSAASEYGIALPGKRR
jgi:hypothetical protein